jgi:hypothetical protein
MFMFKAIAKVLFTIEIKALFIRRYSRKKRLNMTRKVNRVPTLVDDQMNDGESTHRFVATGTGVFSRFSSVISDVESAVAANDRRISFSDSTKGKPSKESTATVTIGPGTSVSTETPATDKIRRKVSGFASTTGKAILIIKIGTVVCVCLFITATIATTTIIFEINSEIQGSVSRIHDMGHRRYLSINAAQYAKELYLIKHDANPFGAD